MAKIKVQHHRGGNETQSKNNIADREISINTEDQELIVNDSSNFLHIPSEEKLASQGLTVSDLNVTGDINFAGDIIQSVSQTVSIGDPIFVLANQNTGNLYDLGFIAKRNSGNVGLIYKESTDRFELIKTDDDGSSNTITSTDYSDLRIGGLTVDDDINSTGNITISKDGPILSIQDNNSSIDRFAAIELMTASGTWIVSNGREGLSKTGFYIHKEGVDYVSIDRDTKKLTTYGAINVDGDINSSEYNTTIDKSTGINLQYKVGPSNRSTSIAQDIIMDGSINCGLVTEDGVNLVDKYLSKTGGTIDGVLSIGDGDTSPGDTLLRFETDRPWAFCHTGDEGSLANLGLVSDSTNKKFTIGSVGEEDIFKFVVSAAPSLTVSGKVIAETAIISALPTSSASLSAGSLYTQTLTEIGLSGTEKVLMVV